MANPAIVHSGGDLTSDVSLPANVQTNIFNFSGAAFAPSDSGKWLLTVLTRVVLVAAVATKVIARIESIGSSIEVQNKASECTLVPNVPFALVMHYANGYKDGDVWDVALELRPDHAVTAKALTSQLSYPGASCMNIYAFPNT